MAHWDEVVDPLDAAAYEAVHGYVNPYTRKKGAIGLSQAMNVPASTLQNKANPTQGFTDFSLKEARAVMLATGDLGMVRRLALDVGGVFVPLPAQDFPADMDVLEAWGAWQVEVAQTVERIQAALKDGRVSRAEVQGVRDELAADFARGMGLVEVLLRMSDPG